MFILSVEFLDTYETGVVREMHVIKRSMTFGCFRHNEKRPRRARVQRSGGTPPASLRNAKCFFKVNLLNCNSVFTFILTMLQNANVNAPAMEANRKMEKLAALREWLVLQSVKSAFIAACRTSSCRKRTSSRCRRHN